MVTRRTIKECRGVFDLFLSHHPEEYIQTQVTKQLIIQSRRHPTPVVLQRHRWSQVFRNYRRRVHVITTERVRDRGRSHGTSHVQPPFYFQSEMEVKRRNGIYSVTCLKTLFCTSTEPPTPSSHRDAELRS